MIAPASRASFTALPLPMNIERINVSPSAGMRTRGGAARPRPRPRPRIPAQADVHGDDRSLVTLGQHADREVVEHATVDEEALLVSRGGKRPGMLMDDITAEVSSPVRWT